MRCFFTNEKCNEMMRWISLINKLFSDINISQGSVATRLRCGVGYLMNVALQIFWRLQQ